MKYVFKENSYYADYLMKMKTMIVLYDVYCVVTYPEYSHVRNLSYENIVFIGEICWLLTFFKDQSSGSRCSIAFLKNY
jgi:hypothetical protein